MLPHNVLLPKIQEHYQILNDKTEERLSFFIQMKIMFFR